MSALLGAIIGDISGSRFEFNNINNKDFELLDDNCWFTDDTILSLAIKKAIITNSDISKTVREVCLPYIDSELRSFGINFRNYVKTGKANNSYGNGSAIRVAFIGQYYSKLNQVLNVAKESAVISHTHPDGIKGAQCIAGNVFLASNRATKADIVAFTNMFYPVNLNELKPTGIFEVSCSGSVPYAIKAVINTENFEDCIKTAISYGGDSDSIACMAGSIAGAMYPEDVSKFEAKALSYLDDELKELYNLEEDWVSALESSFDETKSELAESWFNIKEKQNHKLDKNKTNKIYSPLTKYYDAILEYQESNENNKIDKYRDVVSSFLKDLYEFADNHPEYNTFDYQSVINTTCSKNIKDIDVDNASGKLVVSLLMFAHRAERWANENPSWCLFDNDNVLKYLGRLKQLDEELG